MMRSLLNPILLFFCITAQAQPRPGDVFREYVWHNASGDCNGALRVGGKLDYRLTEAADDYRGRGMISPPFELDLVHATRAELVVEKMLCHGGTKGLRVSINEHEAMILPEAPGIPKPQAEYAHHFNTVVQVDLSSLYPGTGNSFLFEVDTAGHWWPQNLVYGMILRVYYEEGQVTDRGKISFPAPGDTLGTENRIRVEVPAGEMVNSIDLVGYYEDADLEGDGIYRQWHYAYHKGLIYDHIGTVNIAPFQLNWNTEWIPDQQDEIMLAAFVHLKNGYTYMTEAIEDLTLDRPSYSVELCKPYMRPMQWFTRDGEFSERFRLTGDPSRIREARLLFRSWSPGYFNGIYINNFLVFIKEGPKYDYFLHGIPIETFMLETGENILTTGMTPLYNGQMVHGVEIQWPGIMVLIKYDTRTHQ